MTGSEFSDLNRLEGLGPRAPRGATISPDAGNQSRGELFAALAKAQGEMGSAKKDKRNPHLKNKYADLASVWDACRGPLSRNGLSVLQWSPSEATPGFATIVTELGHSSGASVRSWTRVPIGRGNKGVNEAQAMGASTTYARRYGLSALVGIAQDDDDGNAAGAPQAAQSEQPWERHKREAHEAYLAAKDKANDAAKAADPGQSDPDIGARFLELHTARDCNEFVAWLKTREAAGATK